MPASRPRSRLYFSFSIPLRWNSSLHDYWWQWWPIQGNIVDSGEKFAHCERVPSQTKLNCPLILSETARWLILKKRPWMFYISVAQKWNVAVCRFTYLFSKLVLCSYFQVKNLDYTYYYRILQYFFPRLRTSGFICQRRLLCALPT